MTDADVWSERRERRHAALARAIDEWASACERDAETAASVARASTRPETRDRMARVAAESVREWLCASDVRRTIEGVCR